jgi:two-component system, LytTR family, response regulator AlgR
MTAPTPHSVLIVDDEQPARERLERLVADIDGWTIVGSCATGLEALDLVTSRGPAVVLMDIRMPGMTGLEAARHLSALDQPPAVVFTTAYDQYALDAFESQAVGYLLKPVRRERLAEALKHAARLTAPQLRGLSGPAREFAARTHVAVRVRDDLKLIALKDVLYFRADQKYVTIRHAHGEDLLDESLRQLEEEFAADFVRAHRSLLVAVAHVQALEKTADGGYVLRLRGQTDLLAVSRRQLAELRKRLGGRRESA